LGRQDERLLSRLLVYNSVLYHDYLLPVLTIVIYPFRVEMAVPTLVVANREKEILKFDFQTLSLFTMDVEAYVEHHRTCMYP
jgi:hypothetical protein